MYTFGSPLTAIVNPPDLQSVMPDDRLELSVIVQNQGDQGAVIDIYLDDSDQIPSQWCRSARQRLALDPQQNGEVVFEFELPSSALPGTYDYTIVLDAPYHYPEDTPIQYPQQMRVLLREQTVVRVNDPSFFLNPATNPQKPARLNPGEVLPIQVRVENRSNLVDKFRLTCLDLEEEWFSIRYPGKSLDGPGLVAEASSLELNPNMSGYIQLELHPPADMLAGTYTPTLRLYSDNQPDLVLLDLVYLEIRSVEQLTVDLETLIGKVSQRPGKYLLKLHNAGNVIRQLTVRAQSRDEEEICTYDFDPPQVRLPPNRDAEILLQVTPMKQRRRPMMGAGQVINFQIELEDAQGYKLPEKLPQGMLIWKARPWWQFVLLVLLILGILGGVGALIWLMFFKPAPPLAISDVTPSSTNFVEDNAVRISWTIRNADRLQQLQLITQGPNNFIETKQFSRSDLDALCQEQELDLICKNYLTSAGAPGEYTFVLNAISQSSKVPVSANLKVTIAPKPPPEVVTFETTRSDYQSGEPVLLNWEIKNAAQLTDLRVIANDQENKAIPLRAVYTSAQGIPDDLASHCTLADSVFSCAEVPISIPKAGQYTVELQGTDNHGEAVAAEPVATVTIAPRALSISATLNGHPPGNVTLQSDEPITISWQVEGGEGEVKVAIQPYGRVPKSGSQTYPAFNAATISNITLTAIDEAQQEEQLGFVVTVIAPSPSPTPSPSPPTPASPDAASSSAGGSVAPVRSNPTTEPLAPANPQGGW